MIFTATEHCEGCKHLPKPQKKEVESAIASITPPGPKGSSTKKMRSEFLSSLKKSGWTNELTVAQESGMTITTSREQVGLCLQTGNMARMYADLMKLQTLYLDGAIKVAVIVLPSSATYRQTSGRSRQWKWTSPPNKLDGAATATGQCRQTPDQLDGQVEGRRGFVKKQPKLS